MSRLVLLLVLISAAASVKVKYPLWDGSLGSIEAGSYLLADETNDGDNGKNLIRDITRIIHAKQHPPKEQCKSKRLLILQMSSTSFEGTGSILKQVLIGLSVAMHSNRTLVWGLGNPFYFEHTKDQWAGPDRQHLRVNQDYFNCTQHDIGGGPFGCFFEPISSCSLADAKEQELIDFSNNPYNESSRLMMSEMRKGVSLYQPPFGLMEYIAAAKKASYSKHEFRGREAHLWTAAVGSYVFRLKPDVVQTFSKRYDGLYPTEKGAKVWGAHVRHGDLKALSNVYTYKKVFEFEEFFGAARKLSHLRHESPHALFVATDSVQADDLDSVFAQFNKKAKPAIGKDSEAPSSGGRGGKKPKAVKRSDLYDDDDDDDEGDDWEDDEDGDDEVKELFGGKSGAGGSQRKFSFDPSSDNENDDEDDEGNFLSDNSANILENIQAEGWFGGKAPALASLGHEKRYRTRHGSHTVAANGGCLRDPKYTERGMRCSMNYEDIVQYQSLDEHRNTPRSIRMMRVLLESIEDMFLLSRCTVLVGQASSHFTTLAAMLVWANTGAKNVLETVFFLDMETIAPGFSPTAFLHGMNLLNGTYELEVKTPELGAQRWFLHTYAFISGMENKPSAVSLDYNPWGPKNRMRIMNGLPHLPQKVFYTEAKSWLGAKTYKPNWPGECPGRIKRGENLAQYVVTVINLGVEHLDRSHPGQAMQCWTDAMAAMSAAGSKKQDPQVESVLQNALDIARGNMRTMALTRYSEMATERLELSAEIRAEDRLNSDEQRSVADVDEEIARLEEKLEKMKTMRDKMLHLSKLYIAEGKIPPVNAQGTL